MNALWTCTCTYSVCLYNLLWSLNLHNQWSWIFHSHTQFLQDVMQSCSTAFLCGRRLLCALNTFWRVSSMKRLQANYLCNKCIIDYMYMQVVFHTHNYITQFKCLQHLNLRQFLCCNKCKCFTQSRNLRNLKIAPSTLRIWKLHANLKIVH